MIRFLSVTNLAVIDRLELEFAPGPTVLTGETGAGKSILVGAVGLLVGGRASSELVRTGADAATVQAVFETPDGGELIGRREIPRRGAAARSPTARASRAARCATPRDRWSICTGSTSTRSSSIRRRISICSTSSRG